jgi:hypothetical protein
MMNDLEFAAELTEALVAYVDAGNAARENEHEETRDKYTSEEPEHNTVYVRTFEEAMVLTDDVGMVVTYNGARFRVTIQQVE